ncbi:hypothetical protein [Kamptonema formosum]|uniref:hypothetical protein n=1 Tax=Kamptonema formosum TaxID=331992 RepID=UPI0012DD4F80|nr:hypothetical protein [Oscillatoria sp. PCC 10802]
MHTAISPAPNWECRWGEPLDLFLIGNWQFAKAGCARRKATHSETAPPQGAGVSRHRLPTPGIFPTGSHPLLWQSFRPAQ